MEVGVQRTPAGGGDWEMIAAAALIVHVSKLYSNNIQLLAISCKCRTMDLVFLLLVVILFTFFLIKLISEGISNKTMSSQCGLAKPSLQSCVSVH